MDEKVIAPVPLIENKSLSSPDKEKPIASSSTSVTVTVVTEVVFSSFEKLEAKSSITGASFTGLTVIIILPEATVPSTFTVYIKSS